MSNCCNESVGRLIADRLTNISQSVSPCSHFSQWICVWLSQYLYDYIFRLLTEFDLWVSTLSLHLQWPVFAPDHLWFSCPQWSKSNITRYLVFTSRAWWLFHCLFTEGSKFHLHWHCSNVRDEVTVAKFLTKHRLIIQKAQRWWLLYLAGWPRRTTIRSSDLFSLLIP